MAIRTTTAPKASATARLNAVRSARLPLVTLISSLMWNPAQAVEFELGNLQGRFDSNLSIGASWRMEDPDKNNLSQSNGGTLNTSSVTTNGVNDDGNLNFKKGNTFTQIFKGVHDLSLSYDNVGAFVRGKYWYDFELKDGDQHWGHGPNGYAAGESLNDDGFNDYAKFSGAEILDAFAYANFDLGTMPATVRVGRQVVSWGESTFIQGGVNAINPVDVAAFRRPGAEIKEGLLPVSMLYANVGVTDNLSVEGFYQLKWEETAIDGCGTYFSTVDYIAEGCNTLTLGSAADLQAKTMIALGSPVTDPTVQFLLNSTQDKDAFKNGFYVERRKDNGLEKPTDSGQFGLAFRYFAEQLNSTEFGFYYMNYHSRLPVASGVTTNAVQMSATGRPFIPVGTPGVPSSFENPVYFSEYLEDISLLGLSFSTNVGELALSGEISHHRDVPIQINGADLVGSILTAGTQKIDRDNDLSTGLSGLEAENPINQRVGAGFSKVGFGAVVSGYDRFDITQAQMTAIKFVDRVLGASRLTLAGEVAFNHIHDFKDADEGGVRYGRPSEYGQTGTDGFVTQNSWGYRARAVFAYPDAIAGVNLSPSIAWSHDVEGYSAVNTGFVEGRKAVSLGLNADYRNTYNASIAYTRFSGGDYDLNKDRDFLSASIGVSF